MSSENQDEIVGEELLDELGASFLEAHEGGNDSVDDISEIRPSQSMSEVDNETSEKAADKETTNVVEEMEEDEILDQEGQEAEAEVHDVEGDEAEEIVLDADAEVPEGEAEVVEEVEEKETAETENKSSTKSEPQSQKSEAKTKEDQEEEEEAKENEEVEKTMVEKFDPNQMPQVNVATLAVRRWQVKVYPLRPSDFMSGHISRVFKQAKESLLYLYTAGNNGKFSNGKAELYMSTISQATKVMHNLLKMDFFHPEANIKIIRKNDAGVVVEKAYMRFDTKMASLLCQPSGPVRRVGSKRERIIGSVFLKNLPDGATKDMLRVMFPFAAEINFNPEKFKDSTARLVLSNRNGVIPCLKAFSKVELGGNILELRPLEKRKRPDDTPKKVSDGEKSKEEDKSASAAANTKDAAKTPPKKEDTKPSVEKETSKKATSTEPGSQDQKDNRKPGPQQKKPDPKRPRNDSTQGSQSSSSKTGAAKKHPQSKFGPQRWQDRQTGFNRNRGNMMRSAGNRGRGGSSYAGNRSRFGYGDTSFRTGSSPGRMAAVSMGRADPVGAEMTKEMMQLQAQLSVAIKNQMSMLNQTQLALEQAKRGAAVSTAAAAAAAMGVSGNNRLGGFSRGIDVAQDQYSRLSEQTRRSQAESTNRQRAGNRNRARERQDSFGGRGSNRGNRDNRASNFGGKRNLARSSFGNDSYDDVPYPKRSNLGQGRNWAEETEDLDLFSSSASFGAGGYGADTTDYADDGYGGAYDSRRASASSRGYGNTSFGASARNLEYNGTGYEYGY